MLRTHHDSRRKVRNMEVGPSAHGFVSHRLMIASHVNLSALLRKRQNNSDQISGLFVRTRLVFLAHGTSPAPSSPWNSSFFSLSPSKGSVWQGPPPWLVCPPSLFAVDFFTTAVAHTPPELVLFSRSLHAGELLRHGHHLRRQGPLVVRRGRDPDGGVPAGLRGLRPPKDHAVRAGLHGALGEKREGEKTNRGRRRERERERERAARHADVVLPQFVNVCQPVSTPSRNLFFFFFVLLARTPSRCLPEKGK